MTTLNLGLIHSDMPSLQREQVAALVLDMIQSEPSIEVAEMTIQAHHNYKNVQRMKAEKLH